MKSIKSSILKLTALFLTLLLCACARQPEVEAPISPPGDAGVPQPSPQEALPGGELKIPMTRTPATLHPLYLKEAQMRNVYSMIFEPLLEFDENMEPAACLAQSWRYDAAQNVWIFELRSNVHWHGELGEVSGSDAAFTINTILNDAASIYHATLSYYLQRAEGYGTTLVLYPKTPSYALLYALNIPIIPEAYYSGKPAGTMDLPRGSGCFCAQSFTQEGQTRLFLEANTKWWKKTPVLERVTAIGYADTEEVIQAFLSGELDCVPTSLMTTDIYEIIDGVSALDYTSRNYVYLGTNFSKPFLADTAFRQAIAYAINRTAIINNIYLTKATGTEQPLYNDSSLSSANVQRYDTNLTRSRELLASLGYTDTDGDGFVERGGAPITLTLAVINVPENPVRREAALSIARNLKEAGILVNVTALSEANLKNAIAKNDYDLILSGYYLSEAPALRFALQGEGNLSRYASDEMNGILNQMDAAGTLEELKSAVNGLQTVFARDLPHIGLFFERNTFLYRSDLVPSGIKRDFDVYSKISTWYFVKNTEEAG